MVQKKPAQKNPARAKPAQKKADQSRRTPIKRFGMFEGVFTPTILSILGVIMYLRLGYIVGTAGLAWTIIIILLAVSITLSTALSLSSISSNIQIGQGGVYSIISKSLGLEVGGSIGIPLYLAYVFSVSLYIFGFTEAFLYIFPAVPRLNILAGVFLLLFLSVVIDTKIAIRIQSVVLGVLILSLISIFLGGNWAGAYGAVSEIPSAPIPNFWLLFALFFPAVTGITAGIGMSGELKDPQRDIPRGMMSAILVTSAIYIVMAIWFAHSAAPDLLLSNYLIVAELARWAPLVLAGVLTATFCSALTTFIAAPRVLQALAHHKILPEGSTFFSKLSAKGEPRNAVLVTAVLVVAILLVGNLNAVAPYITIFFLGTYMMLHIVVFIEQSLGLVTFRPTVKIPKFVPLYGATISIVVMFLINPAVAMGAFVFVFSVYFWLMKQNIQTPWSDARSGLLTVFSEWSAKKIAKLQKSREHSWKPNLLLPVLRTRTLTGNFPLIRAMLYPNGSLTVLGIKLLSHKGSPVEHRQGKSTKAINRPIEEEMEDSLAQLPSIIKKFGDQGIFASETTIETDNYTDGVGISLQAMAGLVFYPNMVFLPFDVRRTDKRAIRKIFNIAEKHRAGVLLFDHHPEVGLGASTDIHLWLPQEESWDINSPKIYDLAMLVAYKLKMNWNGKIHIWMCVDKNEAKNAQRYLTRLLYIARMPENTQVHISTESFSKTITSAPHGDIHIFPLEKKLNMRKIVRIVEIAERSCLFVLDSGEENILA